MVYAYRFILYVALNVTLFYLIDLMWNSYVKGGISPKVRIKSINTWA